MDFPFQGDQSNRDEIHRPPVVISQIVISYQSIVPGVDRLYFSSGYTQFKSGDLSGFMPNQDAHGSPFRKAFMPSELSLCNILTGQ